MTVKSWRYTASIKRKSNGQSVYRNTVGEVYATSEQEAVTKAIAECEASYTFPVLINLQILETLEVVKGAKPN